METHKRAVDAHQSTDPKFSHWKGRFKVAAGAFEQGKLKEARTLVYKSLLEAEQLDDRDFAVPGSQLAMAVISMEQGDLKESNEYFDKGLNKLRGHADPACQELYAAGLRFKAIWHEHNKDLSSAEACLRESIKILKDLSIGSSVQLAYSLSDLGYIMIRTDKIPEADALIKSAIEILTATVGKEDSSYEWAKMLYQVCHTKGNEDLFIATFELSATQLQYKVGGRHPNLIRALHAYAAALKERGMTEKLHEVKENFVALYKV